MALRSTAWAVCLVLSAAISAGAALANQPPNITISIKDHGAASVPADGATIYDPTPEIVIDYNDDNEAPPGVIDPAKVKIWINGTDSASTGICGKTATQATCQVSTGWSAGNNFVWASVQDSPVGAPGGYSSTASAHVTLSPPVLAPWFVYYWTIGSTVTLDGTGFHPTAGSNQVKVSGVPAVVTQVTATSISFTIPNGATSGPVTLTVDGRTSADYPVVILGEINQGAPSSIAVSPLPGGHLLYTAGVNNKFLQETQDDGSIVGLCDAPENLPSAGLPLDSSGNVYVGQVSTAFVKQGFLLRAVPGSTTCETFMETTRLGACEIDPNVKCNRHEQCAPGLCSYTETAALSDGVASSGNTIYTADSFNGKIKRIDPVGNLVDRKALGIASGLTLGSTTGMTVLGSNLYFTSGVNGENIKRIPIPAGGSATQVRDVTGACGGGSGGARGLAKTSDGKLLVGRGGCVSALDPAISNQEYWNYWSMNWPVTPHPSVAIGSDANGPFIATSDGTLAYRIFKPIVRVRDGNGGALPAKLLIDFPSANTACTANTSITLSVGFTPFALVPDTTPKQKIKWTIEDPDDPSPDSMVDPTDPTGPLPDNVLPIGSYNQWEGVSGFTMTGKKNDNSVFTEIVGNVSKIKFHPSCFAGDNYRFHAIVTVPVYGNIEGVSDTVTVWRKLHIERDSMGSYAGAFNADDVNPGDVPDPILEYLSTAFKPAYIDVALPPDTGQDSPNVAFKYNLDNNAAKMNQQANLGRGSTSTEGRWVAYVQGGYEGDTALDLDPVPPDTGDAWIGGTSSNRNSFTYWETIRDANATFGVDQQYLLSSVALHEITHQFTVPDIPMVCIMASAPYLSPVLCPAHIRTIRTQSHPSKP